MANEAKANEEVQTSEVVQFNPVGNLPSLEKEMEASPISEVAEYWTPEEIGETKRVFFDCVQQVQQEDFETGEVKDMETVIMWEQDKDGNVAKITNSSARLVGSFKSSNFPHGQALQITYKGKKKNKNNSYSSDTWDIFKLYPKK